MMEKCQKHTHFQTNAPYDKERFDLKKELAREELLGKDISSITTQIRSS
ncbi:hypothetical protein HC358_03050 [Wolbachia pipientis]|uniref:Uncharacterized protein n=1 Tax=Wolbachia pipientis TaxID=955 RepID=A0A7G5C903_WOLPI|nr:hypothetical protein [Wolbachia pipientis]QMV45687.1 hypothetical protein HC358_00765 [Wolbachia pipientis]QMV46053.1 hypothetical protein HC358_03050 [Wolbachia pipientis]